jgi:diaminopimelate epimerase
VKFVKMEGAGNDYVLVDTHRETVVDPEALAMAVSDRHFGIGADGLILLTPSERADVRMVMYNADGSRAQMCGNGLRLLAKLARDDGLVDGDEMIVETDAGLLPTTLVRDGGDIVGARVLMGVPRVTSGIDEPITVHDRTFRMTTVDMGNPHAVIFIDEDLDAFPLERFGSAIETASRFPERTNVEFVSATDPHLLCQRTWERGAGETLACGTGACAATVAAVLGGRATTPLTISLRGGDLEAEWDGEDSQIVLTGPAVEVFRGDYAPR